MSDKHTQLVIIGDGEFAQIAYEYFTVDSPYDVVGFSVEEPYLKRDELFGLPVRPFETLEGWFDPQVFRVFVAVTWTQLNRVRARLYRAVKEKGFSPVSYISSRAFVWRTAALGENCFVFENNVIQHKVTIGDNVILWSGNHIGHQSVIHDHCFLSSHCVISGYCEVGERSFLGVNCTLADHVTVGRDCLIGAGALITKSTEDAKIYPGVATKPSSLSSMKYFGLKE
jgi:sugar O-acyltransferase (sialic acid O-acetyltransferase NeuD family)